MPQENDAPYTMGRTQEEYERLRRQARIWEPATRRLLQQAGLKEGMSCLDVGSGPGEVMRLLGEAVGPSGSVTGLDMDAVLGRETLARLQASGQSRYRFIEGDIQKVAEIEGAPFDLVCARLTLLYVRDPVDVLRRMHGMLRPGGALIVQEFDHSTYQIHPRTPALEEFERVLQGAFEHGGRDLRLGLKLGTLFCQAGIGVPDGTDVAAHLVPLSRAAPMVTAAYQSVMPLALKLGITSAAASASFLREMEQAAGNDQYFSLTPLLIGAWKRKAS